MYYAHFLFLQVGQDVGVEEGVPSAAELVRTLLRLCAVPAA
jgi:hypothetical protein